ncbi:MAG: UbiA family prenyltransferase [Euzebya sp.]
MTTATTGRSSAGGLLLASHPGPSAVVTMVAAGLCGAAGLPLGRGVVVTTAVAAGQLSIGWCNDWWDARLDRDRDRLDKPLQLGTVSPHTVGVAAATAAVVCIAASVSLGPLAAIVHLVAVASGWAYNLWLKATLFSVAPYVISFGLLPTVVTAAAGSGAAPWWAGVAGACFGAGVHFANVLPDLAGDEAVGVNGLPHRLGATGSLAATVVLLGLGAACVLIAPPGAAADARTVVGAAVIIGLLIALMIAGVRMRFDIAFKLAMASGLALVLLLVLSGSDLR